MKLKLINSIMQKKMKFKMKKTNIILLMKNEKKPRDKNQKYQSLPGTQEFSKKK